MNGLAFPVFFRTTPKRQVLKIVYNVVRPRLEGLKYPVEILCMKTITVWLLLVSPGSYSRMDMVPVHFASAAACEQARAELPNADNPKFGHRSACIQAQILAP